MSTGGRLRAHLPEIRAELSRIRASWAGELLEHLEQSIAADCRSADVLSRANAERQAQVRAAIHRAASNYLTPAFRRFTPRRAWTGALWSYLERRYAQYGLKRHPCRRSIRAALILWSPPSGGALSTL